MAGRWPHRRELYGGGGFFFMRGAMSEDSLRTLFKIAGGFVFSATIAGATPQVRSILNAASYAQSGLPNSGIARGSMFVVFGTELGPADLRQAAGFPLQTSLGGTSIRVSVGTTTVDALLVYVWAT